SGHDPLRRARRAMRRAARQQCRGGDLGTAGGYRALRTAAAARRRRQCPERDGRRQGVPRRISRFPSEGRRCRAAGAGASFVAHAGRRPHPYAYEGGKMRRYPGRAMKAMQEKGMAKDAIVSDEFAKKFAAEKETPYTRWVRSEGLDLISSTYVPNLHTVELKPWGRRGGSGIFMNHEASRTSNDCYVCEIPAGKTLAPQRQLFEETIMILSGRGSTTVWNDAGQRITFEWKAGALFAIPLNCWHQHFNGSGREGARFVSVTNAPIVINLYEDLD